MKLLHVFLLVAVVTVTMSIGIMAEEHEAERQILDTVKFTTDGEKVHIIIKGWSLAKKIINEILGPEMAKGAIDGLSEKIQKHRAS